MLPTCASQGLVSWQPAQGTAGKMLNPGSGPAASCCQELIHSCWLLTLPHKLPLNIFRLSLNIDMLSINTVVLCINIKL